MTMAIPIVVMMVLIADVGAPLRLKRGVNLHKLRSETTKHLLDYMIRPDAEDMLANFSRQMSISEMPG
jgi:hypothetical protein